MDSPQEPAAIRNNPPVETEHVEISTPKKLTNLLLTNIAVLSIVGLFSVVLLMFGDFEGKTIRVLSTLMVFAAFTAYTSLATRISHSQRSTQIAQSANIYMLVLSLLLIWATLGKPGYTEYALIPLCTIALIAITGVGSYLMQMFAQPIDSKYPQVKNSAILGSGTFGLSLILLTLPIGLWDLFDFTSFYWKITVSVLLIAGVSMSIEALVTRFFKDKKPASNPAVNPADAVAVNQARNTAETAPVATETKPVGQENPSLPIAPQSYHQPKETSVGAWPVYPNGLPLPALPNGRPDYASLQYIAAVFVESEKQWTNV